MLLEFIRNSPERQATSISLDQDSLSKSEFIIYRLMAARSKILWGENVHRFYQVVGVIVIVFGALVALGYIGR